MSTSSIFESIELSTSSNWLLPEAPRVDHSHRWGRTQHCILPKDKLIQLCRENLNRPEVIGRMTLNNKLTATVLRELNVLKENFAITKVDKLSHYLALICKKLYLHELHGDSFGRMCNSTRGSQHYPPSS